MNDPNLCPACLAELPEDYPYDHVRIDRALGGDLRLWSRMSRAERCEVVLTGIERRLDPRGLAEVLGLQYSYVQDVLPAEHPQSRESFLAQVEPQVAQMWADGATYVDITLATGLNERSVTRIRRSLNLPDRPRRPLARKRVAWA